MSTSHVAEYLGVEGLSLNTPLKKRWIVLLLELSQLFIKAIADLKEFIDPYAAPSANLAVRHPLYRWRKRGLEPGFDNTTTKSSETYYTVSLYLLL